VDPAVGQTKQLVVFYEFRGEPHVLAVPEPFPVSYAILAAHATPAPSPIQPGDDGVDIVESYYGLGRMYQLVTARVREFLRPTERPVVVDDALLGVPGATQARMLIVTYTYRGGRHTAVAWKGAPLGHADLVANAMRPREMGPYAASAPDWVRSARPDPARLPGNPGPGTGRSPRRELGISELLKALAELGAIAPEARTASVTSAMASVRVALAGAEREIGYPFPPPGSPAYLPARTTADVHVARATAALVNAQSQFGSATTGRRGRSMLSASLTAIGAALDALGRQPVQ
jgi:hypothetical protein